MFNLPVKLSVLSGRYSAVSPQVFLDKTPEESLMIFMNQLPKEVRYNVEYAFPAKALLLMLENEFEVRVVKRQMFFTKQNLDAQSWLFANGLSEVFYCQEQRMQIIERLASELAKELNIINNPLFLSVNTFIEELKTLIRLYDYKYRNVDFLQSLNSIGGIRLFLNLVVAEALNKADASEALFGIGSVYTCLWKNKQVQYYNYVRYFDQCFLKRSA